MENITVNSSTLWFDRQFDFSLTVLSIVEVLTTLSEVEVFTVLSVIEGP